MIGESPIQLFLLFYSLAACKFAGHDKKSIFFQTGRLERNCMLSRKQRQKLVPNAAVDS